MHPSPLSRRRFLQQSAATLLAAPFVTSGLRAASPNGKLRHAAFGASGMSWSDMTAMSGHPNWELVAVCDVDTRNFARVKEKFPNVRTYQDWRELLEKEAGQIDSVNVSVPDHMHGPIGMNALSRGLNVYGQKPLTQNLHECRAVTLKARETGLNTQMGIQISSDFSERYTVELIHSGVIGKVKEAHTFSNKRWGDMTPLPERSDAIPDGFDWNRWLGVAGERPFLNGYYHPGNWRKRRDFGTGTLGDMGCHMFSGWFRSLALTSPISVKSSGPAPVDKNNWATDGQVEYIFPGTQYTEGPTVKVTWYDGEKRPPANVVELLGDMKWPGQGTLYVGTNGTLLHPHGSPPYLFIDKKRTRVEYPKLEKRNHWFDFIDCCLANDPKKKPSANFDYAGPLTESVLLGCLASIFPEQTLEWNAAKLAFNNNEAANQFVTRQYRHGWEVAGF